jgi:hypothetical protein
MLYFRISQQPSGDGSVQVGNGEDPSWGAFAIDMSDYIDHYALSDPGAGKVKAVVSDQRGQNRVTLKFGEAKANNDIDAEGMTVVGAGGAVLPALARGQIVGLLRLSKSLPWYEGALLKQMLIRPAPVLLLAVAETLRRGSTSDTALGPRAVGKLMHEAVLHAVVEYASNTAHKTWLEIFRDKEFSGAASNEAAKRDREKVLSDQKSGALIGLAPGVEEKAPAYISHLSLTYGEVDFFSQATILERVGVKEGDVFWDLGSGTGRAVVCAALLYGHLFKGCYGLELLPELYDASTRAQVSCIEAVEAKRKWILDGGSVGGCNSQKDKEWAHIDMHCSGMSHGMKSHLSHAPNCTFHIMSKLSPFMLSLTPATPATPSHADIIADPRWLDGDIIFANSTAFDITLMRALAKVAEGMRPGAWIITLTRKLESDSFDLVEKRNYSMSWGTATCYVQQRRTDAAVQAGRNAKASKFEKLPLMWRTCPKGLVLISGEGCVATQTANGDALVTSGVEMVRGQHYWEVELLSESALHIGVCRPKLNPRGEYTGDDCDEGWFIDAADGALFGNGKYDNDGAGEYEQGDRVGVLLNLNDGSLQFYKNSVRHGPGYPAGSITGAVVHALCLRPDARLEAN